MALLQGKHYVYRFRQGDMMRTQRIRNEAELMSHLERAVNTTGPACYDGKPIVLEDYEVFELVPVSVRVKKSLEII